MGTSARRMEVGCHAIVLLSRDCGHELEVCFVSAGLFKEPDKKLSNVQSFPQQPSDETKPDIRPSLKPLPSIN
jgi:hypothetical protein